MSATQTVTIPAHLVPYRGRLINGEVSEQNISELQHYAQLEKFDLEGECRRRYNVKSDWLTYSQWKETFSHVLFCREERINSTPKHYHHCDRCRTSKMHFDRECEGKHEAGDITEECRACRENVTAYSHRGRYEDQPRTVQEGRRPPAPPLHP